MRPTRRATNNDQRSDKRRLTSIEWKGWREARCLPRVHRQGCWQGCPPLSQRVRKLSNVPLLSNANASLRLREFARKTAANTRVSSGVGSLAARPDLPMGKRRPTWSRAEALAPGELGCECGGFVGEGLSEDEVLILQRQLGLLGKAF